MERPVILKYSIDKFGHSSASEFAY